MPELEEDTGVVKSSPLASLMRPLRLRQAGLLTLPGALSTLTSAGKSRRMPFLSLLSLFKPFSP